MKNLFITLTMLSSYIYAGGDIAPVEPAMEPVTSTGDALSITTMIIFMVLTTAVGLFYVKKEQEV